MPAQKRALSQKNLPIEDDSQDSSFRMQSPHQIEQEQEPEKEDFDGAQKSRSSDEKPEYTCIKLQDVRKLVQCPICLGIIKKTRTVMECMHRFCRECIDKSMRLGNKECPACRTHCASRRSLRDDPRYDAIIAYLYEDINEYEEEELAYHEKEKTRNKQIQESIAQIIERQEAHVRKHTPAKESASGYVPRSQRNHRRVHPRPNHRLIELQAYDTSEEENDGSKDRTSSANNLDLNKESRGIFPGLTWKPEILAWGKGGTRSQTRHGSFSGSNSKSARTNRLHKIVEYLENEGQNDDELGIHIMLISLDKQNMSCLQKPFLCCDPSLLVQHLCEYVADQISLRAEEIQMLVLKKHDNVDPSTWMDGPVSMLLGIDTRKDDMQVLEGHETLCGLKADCLSSTLIIAYQKKET